MNKNAFLRVPGCTDVTGEQCERLRIASVRVERLFDGSPKFLVLVGGVVCVRLPHPPSSRGAQRLHQGGLRRAESGADANDATRSGGRYRPSGGSGGAATDGANVGLRGAGQRWRAGHQAAGGHLQLRAPPAAPETRTPQC